MSIWMQTEVYHIIFQMYMAQNEQNIISYVSAKCINNPLQYMNFYTS